MFVLDSNEKGDIAELAITALAWASAVGSLPISPTRSIAPSRWPGLADSLPIR